MLVFYLHISKLHLNNIVFKFTQVIKFLKLVFIKNDNTQLYILIKDTHFNIESI